MAVGTEKKVGMVEGMEIMVGTVAEMIRLATVVDMGLDMVEDMGQDLMEDTSTISMAVVAMGLDMVEATDPVMEVGIVALHAELLATVVVMEVQATVGAMVGAMVEDMVVAVGMEEVGAMEVDMVVAVLHEAHTAAVQSY
jgi:hypothetical protein